MSCLEADFGGVTVTVKKSYYVVFLPNIWHLTVYGTRICESVADGNDPGSHTGETKNPQGPWNRFNG